MKKIFFAVVLALTTMAISAQERVFVEYDVLDDVEGKAARDRNFAIKLGTGISNLSGSDAYSAFSYKVAFSYDCRLAKELYLIPEMDFVVKGSYPTEWISKLDLVYLQVPVCLAWKHNISRKVRLGIKGGPYIAVGLYGSQIIWQENGMYKEKTDVFNSYHGSNRFDAGVMTGVHFDIYAFTIGVEYSCGFLMLNDEYTPLNGYNQAAGVTFGVCF